MRGLLYEVRETAVARLTKHRSQTSAAIFHYMVLRNESLPNSSARAEAAPLRARIFLLSPANASGIKGQRLLSATGESELALRLRGAGAPLGEVYRFISSLYFRGKLDYAEKFQNPPRGLAGVHIITGAGLMLPETVITLSDLRRISATPIDARNSHYRLPLIRICFACENWWAMKRT